MAVYINSPCEICAHRHQEEPHDVHSCDAFPDGILYSIKWKSTKEERKNCNNGIGFELDKVAADKAEALLK